MATYLKVMGLTLDPKLTYSTHIHNISVHAHTPLQMIKTLITTGWAKQEETLMATYKAVMRPALKYASSKWPPLASSTSINKLKAMPNATLRTATGCTQNTHTSHARAPTSQRATKQIETQHPSHPLDKYTTYFNTPRLKTLSSTTDATQQTFPQTPTQLLQQT